MIEQTWCVARLRIPLETCLSMPQYEDINCNFVFVLVVGNVL